MAYAAAYGTKETMSLTPRLGWGSANWMEGSGETRSGNQGYPLEDLQDEVPSDERAIRIAAAAEIALRQCAPSSGRSDWGEDLGREWEEGAPGGSADIGSRGDGHGRRDLGVQALAVALKRGGDGVGVAVVAAA